MVTERPSVANRRQGPGHHLMVTETETQSVTVHAALWENLLFDKCFKIFNYKAINVSVIKEEATSNAVLSTLQILLKPVNAALGLKG